MFSAEFRTLKEKTFVRSFAAKDIGLIYDEKLTIVFMFDSMAFEYYMVRFHYSGTFEGEGLELRYINEIVDDLLLDPDKISYFEFIDICKDTGYRNISRIFYLTPGCSFADGLKEIKDDHSALEMAGNEEGGHDEDHSEEVGNKEGGHNEVHDEVGNEEVRVEDVENENDDEDHYVPIQYLNESDDEELVSTRLKFSVMLGEEGRSRNYGQFDDGCHSEYYDSDEFSIPVSEEEKMVDDATRKKHKYLFYNPNAKSSYIELGMLFENFSQFKHDVALLAIKINRVIIWAKNHKNYVRGKCSDGNNQIYPVAWALVDVESTMTWKWFIDLLKKDIDSLGNENGWTIMSDQHKGLENAIS
ncbi:hypothetical protein REPUB_Repub09cG0146600 [Reevesia pubescens]